MHVVFIYIYACGIHIYLCMWHSYISMHVVFMYIYACGIHIYLCMWYSYISMHVVFMHIMFMYSNTHKYTHTLKSTCTQIPQINKYTYTKDTKKGSHLASVMFAKKGGLHMTKSNRPSSVVKTSQSGRPAASTSRKSILEASSLRTILARATASASRQISVPNMVQPGFMRTAKRGYIQLPPTPTSMPRAEGGMVMSCRCVVCCVRGICAENKATDSRCEIACATMCLCVHALRDSVWPYLAQKCQRVRS